MSQHSMRRGRVGKRRRSCTRAQALVDVVGGAPLLFEGVLGVVGRHFEQRAPRTARRREHLDLGAAAGHHLRAPLDQPLRDAVHAFGQHGHDDLVGHVRLARAAFAVVLAQERGHDLVVRQLDALHRERGDDRSCAPCAHDHHAQLGQVAFAVDAEHVLIAVAHHHHALRFARRLAPPTAGRDRCWPARTPGSGWRSSCAR